MPPSNRITNKAMKKRLNESEKQQLEQEFEKSQNWSTAKISELSLKFALKRIKTYQWFCARNKRAIRQTKI